MNEPGEPGLAGPVRTTLTLGILLSAALLGIGIALALAQGSGLIGAPTTSGHVGPVLSGLLSGRAEAVLLGGVLVLLATPIARVAVSLAHFAGRRDYAFVGITAIVLAVLAVSISVGIAP